VKRDQVAGDPEDPRIPLMPHAVGP
jgi:hypothetical protein